MEKIIKAGDREIKFKVSAMTPILYKRMYERDLFTDIKNIEAGLKLDPNNIGVENLEIFLDLGYCMAKQGDKDIDIFDIWVDSFEIDELYPILGEAMKLWTKSQEPINPEPQKKKMITKK
jgi:hypothetical protein